MYVCMHVSMGTVQLLTSLRRVVVLICRWADISRQIPFSPSTPPSQENHSVWSIPWCLTPLPARCFKEVRADLIDSVMAAQSEPKVTYFFDIRSELACTPAAAQTVVCVSILAVIVMESCHAPLLLWAVIFVYEMYIWVDDTVEYSGSTARCSSHLAFRPRLTEDVLSLWSEILNSCQHLRSFEGQT